MPYPATYFEETTSVSPQFINKVLFVRDLKFPSTAVNLAGAGVVADGSTDNGPILNAILASHAGYPLVLPPGVIRIASQLAIPSNTQLIGAGPGLTTLQVTPGASTRMLYLYDVSNVLISNLTLDPNGANVPDSGADTLQQALYCYTDSSVGLSNIRISNVNVLAGKRHGVNLLMNNQGGNTAVFTFGTITNNSSASTTVSVTGARLRDYSYATFSGSLQGCLMTAQVTANNTVTVTVTNQTGSSQTIASGTISAFVYLTQITPFDVRLDQVNVTGAGRVGIISAYNKGVQVTRCEVKNGSAEGLFFQGCTNYLVQGNASHDNAGHGIMGGVFASDFTIANNDCYGNDPTGSNLGMGIVVSENSQGFVVNANRCYGNGNHGISIDVKRSEPYQNVAVPTRGVVSNNQCNGSVLFHGIYAQYFDGLSLSGNTCSNNTQAGIFLVSGRHAAVEGNTCISNGTYGIACTEAAGGTFVGGSGYYTFGNNNVDSNTSGSYDFAYGLSTAITKPIRVMLSNSGTYDWPSLASGSSQTTTLTVHGAMLGDTASAAMSVSLAGTTLRAEVTAQDTVTVTQSNATGGAVDIPSGTLLVIVTKAY